MKKYIIYFISLSFLIGQNTEANSNFSIPSNVNIEMSGEVEVEFIDVEGPGGASNEDEFLRKIETQKPTYKDR